MSNSVGPYGLNSTCQAPLSLGFSSQEYWSGLPSPPPGDLPKPGIEPMSLSLLHWQGGRFITTSAASEAQSEIYIYLNIYTFYVVLYAI